MTYEITKIAVRLETYTLILDNLSKHVYKFSRSVDLADAIKRRNAFLVKRSIPLRELSKKLAEEQKRLEGAE